MFYNNLSKTRNFRIFFRTCLNSLKINQGENVFKFIEFVRSALNSNTFGRIGVYLAPGAGHPPDTNALVVFNF